MRELYHTHSSHVATGVSDPFADRPPWFQLIGRTFVSLQSLLFEVPIEHKVCCTTRRVRRVFICCLLHYDIA